MLTKRGAATPRELAQAISWERRDFLRTVTGAGAAAALFGLGPMPALASAGVRKVVVVTFGGGARDEETFMPEGQENIPHLLGELIPQATFFTQVVNRGILGHYVATASLATGVYETFNNFAAVAPENPTVFEYFRKDLKRPATDAWVVAPSNGFNRIGESGHRSYGAGLGAGVILPKRLLTAALSSGGQVEYQHLLRDNYETPLYTPELSGSEFELRQLGEILKLSVADFTAHARSLASPDELSVYVAHQLMRQFAPSLLWITLHDIDIAHSGTYSLYIDGIQRSDRLSAEIWKTIQSEPEYAGKTAMFILPDFGRDSDTDSGGNGFQHHRTGDPLSRTTWMMVMGPGIRQNVVVDRPVESTDLVPTLGALLGFSPRLSSGKALAEVT
ncbi:MAG TPA: twin-arginine translocation signal domain-containing protein [Terriglobia bacterium]|nr:twin-arginine translocation signal domain-containing protein [Terriglobia bacterium]